MREFEFMKLLNAQNICMCLSSKRHAIGIMPNYIEKIRNDFPDIDKFISGTGKDPFGRNVVWIKFDK